MVPLDGDVTLPVQLPCTVAPRTGRPTVSVTVISAEAVVRPPRCTSDMRIDCTRTLGGTTLIDTVAVPVAPRLSVTVSVAAKVPVTV